MPFDGVPRSLGPERSEPRPTDAKLLHTIIAISAFGMVLGLLWVLLIEAAWSMALHARAALWWVW